MMYYQNQRSSSLASGEEAIRVMGYNCGKWYFLPQAELIILL
jgi:hypothetical protein